MRLSQIVKFVVAFIIAIGVAGAAGVIAHKAVAPQMPEKNSYIVDVAAANAALAAAASAPKTESVPGKQAAKVEAPETPIEVLLAKADVEAGKKSAKICGTCHSFGKGERAKVGPNLYDIVGAKHAHMAGFNYSAAMQGMADRTWDFEELYHFIRNPREYLPGTKMAFPGLKNEQERANVIAWLRTLSDKPVVLPK